MPALQASTWMCTAFHNVCKDWLENLISHEKVNMVVGQIEQCPDKGTLHLQFCMHSARMTATALKTVMGSPTVHVEKMERSWSECVKYVTKDETRADGPWSFAKPGVSVSANGILVRGGGARTEMARTAKDAKRGRLMETVIDACKEGVELSVVIKRHPGAFMQWGDKIAKLHQMFSKGRVFMPNKKVVLYWGPPRTGKTRRAIYELEKAYGTYDDVHFTSGGFVNGYNGKKGVLFDEPNRDHLDATVMLRLFDHYSCTMNVKGSCVTWDPETVYLTSNMCLAQLTARFPAEQLDAINARVKEVFIGTEWLPPVETVEVDPPVPDVPDAQPLPDDDLWEDIPIMLVPPPSPTASANSGDIAPEEI